MDNLWYMVPIYEHISLSGVYIYIMIIIFNNTFDIYIYIYMNGVEHIIH